MDYCLLYNHLGKKALCVCLCVCVSVCVWVVVCVCHWGGNKSFLFLTADGRDPHGDAAMGLTKDRCLIIDSWEMAVRWEEMQRLMITMDPIYFSDRQKVFDWKLLYVHGHHSVVSLNVLMQNYLIRYTLWVIAYQQWRLLCLPDKERMELLLWERSCAWKGSQHTLSMLQ